jgi:hypothetical protein
MEFVLIKENKKKPRTACRPTLPQRCAQQMPHIYGFRLIFKSIQDTFKFSQPSWCIRGSLTKCDGKYGKRRDTKKLGLSFEIADLI